MLKKGARIGFDPWLHTVSDIRNLKKAVKKAGGKLIAVEQNLVDEIWGRPTPCPR